MLLPGELAAGSWVMLQLRTVFMRQLKPRVCSGCACLIAATSGFLSMPSQQLSQSSATGGRCFFLVVASIGSLTLACAAAMSLVRYEALLGQPVCRCLLPKVWSADGGSAHGPLLLLAAPWLMAALATNRRRLNWCSAATVHLDADRLERRRLAEARCGSAFTASRHGGASTDSAAGPFPCRSAVAC